STVDSLAGMRRASIGDLVRDAVCRSVFHGRVCSARARHCEWISTFARRRSWRSRIGSTNTFCRHSPEREMEVREAYVEQLIGRKVRDERGRELGRIEEMIVEVIDDEYVVT